MSQTVPHHNSLEKITRNRRWSQERIKTSGATAFPFLVHISVWILVIGRVCRCAFAIIFHICVVIAAIVMKLPAPPLPCNLHKDPVWKNKTIFLLCHFCRIVGTCESAAFLTFLVPFASCPVFRSWTTCRCYHDM